MNMKHTIIGLNIKCAERVRSYLRVSHARQIFNVSMNYLRIDFRKGLFLSFCLGFIVRLIPEILSFRYPIGFDTVHYAARIKSGVVWYHWTSMFSTWLLYAISIPVYQITRVDPFLLLKFMAPTLYALNVCGVYYFSRKALNWNTRKASIAAFFFAFQLASLRISWDLYRNTLGLGILLFALPFIKDLKTKKDFALFISLSTLVVLSHELVSVVMFVVVLGVIVSDFLKGERVRVIRDLAAVSVASAIFLTDICLRLLVPINTATEANVISTYQAPAHPGGLFFLVDHLSVSDWVYYSTYLNGVLHVFSLFALLFLACLPLVFVGFFRDKVLDGWTSWLLVGSFSYLIMPLSALAYWHRWMFMLVYPFTFYAVNGIGKVWESKDKIARPNLRWIHWMKVSEGTVRGILVLTVFLGLLFMTIKIGDYGFFSIPTTRLYFPSTMLRNTVLLQDTEDTVKIMEWLDEHMLDGSCVLVHHPFLSWADLYLDKKHVIIDYVNDVEKALNVASEHGFNPIYLIWWDKNTEWYGLTVPEHLIYVFGVERIYVFKLHNNT